MKEIITGKIIEYKENLNILQQQKQKWLFELNEMEIQIQRLTGAISSLEQLLTEAVINGIKTENSN